MLPLLTVPSHDFKTGTAQEYVEYIEKISEVYHYVNEIINVSNFLYVEVQDLKHQVGCLHQEIFALRQRR